jgi:hypothetical protein
MYGGGFATIPAYLADMFGTQYVGAIHGRLLTAWSTAGILGPVIVNYFHDTRKAAGVPVNELYYLIMYILAALLLLGFIANWLIRPVDSKWYMSDSELDVARARSAKGAVIDSGSFGIGRGGLDGNAALAWAVVLIPITWGVWLVVSKLGVLFQ